MRPFDIIILTLQSALQLGAGLQKAAVALHLLLGHCLQLFPFLQ